MDLSILLPVRNEALILSELTSRLKVALKKIKVSFEIIFITDLNTDNTLDVLKELSKGNTEIKVIKLSNSFGQHVAIKAGLDLMNGDAAIIMDADLEMFPEDIPKLYQKYNEGFDIVYAVSKNKNNSKIKDFFSRGFNKIMNLLSDYDSEMNTDMFRIISRKAVEEIKKYRELNPSLPHIMSLINLPTEKIELSFGLRKSGKTNYSFTRQINMAIETILSFSTKPLRIISILGLGISLASFIYLLIILVQKLFITNYGGIGFGTVIVLVIFFGGLQLFAMGIIGEYLGRVFLQSKNRPLYIIEELIGDFE